jgi:hypothetical protein
LTVSWDYNGGRRRRRWRRPLHLLFTLALLVFVCAGWLRAVDLQVAQAGGLSNRSVAERAIRQVFGARSPAAIRVAGCETGWTFYPRAVSRTGDYGLFQANYWAHHWRGESRAEFAARQFNLAYNVRWAYRLSRGGTDWRAWTCRP